MPRRSDISTILVIGSGPIVIGQGCEFDYSGTQACKTLKAEGYRVVLLNSNPATIMTDPELVDRTYVEPITPLFVEKILRAERARGRPVDALLPTLGGQTALNCAMECHERGILREHGVTMIGAGPEAIARAEDRTLFKEAMLRIGLDVPRSGTAHSMEEARSVLRDVGLPCCIRPAYTLGGEGGGFVHTAEEFDRVAARGLKLSRIGEVLIEESLYGWKEFELEVIRDHRDNFIVVCTIENIDPMGVHTGDSITVAPAQTLDDRAYQKMRDAAKQVMREIGVDCGGSNVQFAVCPRTGRQCVIEMNPRVSRSSALASKATGYPIAKVAARLAVGYALDEIPNDITRTTPASFEPVIDYCVVKMPRWTFEKFAEADETLTTQMKSVGEGMAIGRTFKEAFQKCIRSMEVQRAGFGLDRNDRWLAHQPGDSRSALVTSHGLLKSHGLQAVRLDNAPLVPGIETDPVRPVVSTLGEAPPDVDESTATHWPIEPDALRLKLETPCQGRPYYIRYAFKLGWTVDQVHELTRIDPWFLEQMKELVEFEQRLFENAPQVRAAMELGGDGDSETGAALLRQARLLGYSNAQLIQAIHWQGPDLNTGNVVVRESGDTKTNGGTGIKGGTGVSPVLNGQDARTTPALGQDARTTPALGQDARTTPALGQEARTTHRNCPTSDGCFRMVDTCAAEFDAATPYYYATHEAPFHRVENGHVVRAVDQEIVLRDEPHVVVLGGGPNRIGQGIEFDYCSVHAAMEARRLNFRTVMINSNPETVSTDYDTSDVLFFEPLTHEDVMRVLRTIERQSRLHGVIVQFGGQTPLNLAQGLKAAGAPIIGTPPESIHLAEDRDEFQALLAGLGLRQPESGAARNVDEALRIADRLGYPVLIRPSYVLGGRAMELCNNDADLRRYVARALAATDRVAGDSGKSAPSVLIDKFLLDATEIDVDAVADFSRPGDERGDCVVCGIMEHIEQAGIHSGDSTCALPPHSLSAEMVRELERQTRLLARAIGVRGLMNVQFAIQSRDRVCQSRDREGAGSFDFRENPLADARGSEIQSRDREGAGSFDFRENPLADARGSEKQSRDHEGAGSFDFRENPLADARGSEKQSRDREGAGSSSDAIVYVLEVNPRASRTVPFVSKATGVPWAKVATGVMLGRTLRDVLWDYGVGRRPRAIMTAIKAPVFPFKKFPGVDAVLGPEMRSTGEVMGIDESFGLAFAKAAIATGLSLPTTGNALVSVNDPDKPRVIPIARELRRMGFKLFATIGTHRALKAEGIPSVVVSKQAGAPEGFLLDLINHGVLDLLINTPVHYGAAWEEGRWRAAATARNVPLITTIAGAHAAVSAIAALKARGLEEALAVKALQDYGAGL